MVCHANQWPTHRGRPGGTPPVRVITLVGARGGGGTGGRGRGRVCDCLHAFGVGGSAPECLWCPGALMPSLWWVSCGPLCKSSNQRWLPRALLPSPVFSSSCAHPATTPTTHILAGPSFPLLSPPPLLSSLPSPPRLPSLLPLLTRLLPAATSPPRGRVPVAASHGMQLTLAMSCNAKTNRHPLPLLLRPCLLRTAAARARHRRTKTCARPRKPCAATPPPLPHPQLHPCRAKP